jgi:acyl carrier protein
VFKRNKKQALPEGPLTEESLRLWLMQHLAVRTELPLSEIDPTKTFEEYGLDSRVAVQVSGLLEKVVERRLSPALLYEHPTVDALSRHLAQELHLARSSS